MKELENHCYLSASLICLDMLRVLDQVQELSNAGLEMLHIDILDGHFSPSMPLGFELVKQLRKKTDLFFDCHVMVSSPEYYIEELIDIGVDQIAFHVETADHVDGLINRIHNAGIRAGVALKPSTPVSTLDYVIEKCDSVLLMLINPGYASSAGEKQVSYATRKIQDLHELIHRNHSKAVIEVDGRISLDNMTQFPDYGVQIYVGGTTCLDRSDLSGSVKKIHKLWGIV